MHFHKINKKYNFVHSYIFCQLLPFTSPLTSFCFDVYNNKYNDIKTDLTHSWSFYQDCIIFHYFSNYVSSHYLHL